MRKRDPRLNRLAMERSRRGGIKFREFMAEHPELDEDDPDWPAEARNAYDAFMAEEDAWYQAEKAALIRQIAVERAAGEKN